MSESLKGAVAATVAVGAAEAFALVSSVTLDPHRKVTHESLELGPVVQFLTSTALFTTGTLSEVWADTHGPGHHRLRDATFVEILKVGDHLAWRKAHPEVHYPPIPEIFPNLDPGAELYPEDIEMLTASVRDLPVADEKTIKDLYDRPESYSIEEMEKLLDTETARYFYEDRPGIIRRWLGSKAVEASTEPKPRTIDSIVHWLRDAHSPALDRRGVLGILLRNVRRYRESAKEFYRERLERNDFDTSTWYKRFFLKHRKWALPTGFAINIVPLLAKSFLRGELTRKRAATDIGHGAARTGLAYAGLNAGGNITNAFGHGIIELVHMVRKYGVKGVWKALTGPAVMKEDGTYTNDAKPLSLFTLDEVGGQDVHHKRPDKVAYSMSHGFKKFVEAPYGTTLEFLAKHKIGMRPGPQFGERDNPENFDRSKRPDMPAEAVLALESFRVRTLKQRQQRALEQIAA